MKIKPHEVLGPISNQLCHLFNGVIIGGAAKAFYEGKTGMIKDIDIVIPLDKWNQASRLIPKGSISNSFGGFKFLDGNYSTDVWTDDVARIALSYKVCIFNPVNNRYLLVDGE